MVPQLLQRAPHGRVRSGQELALDQGHPVAVLEDRSPQVRRDEDQAHQLPATLVVRVTIPSNYVTSPFRQNHKTGDASPLTFPPHEHPLDLVNVPVQLPSLSRPSWKTIGDTPSKNLPFPLLATQERIIRSRINFRVEYHLA